MKRLVVGVLLGLSIAAIPAAAEWGACTGLFGPCEGSPDRKNLTSLVQAFSTIPGTLERIASALERAYPPPAEKARVR